MIQHILDLEEIRLFIDEKGELHNYNLQIRTIGKYPVQTNGVVDGFYNINYNISKLFKP